MKRFITFTCLALLLIACKKEVTIVGKVYNPVTGEGIPGIEVRVLKQKNGVPGAMDGSGSKLIFSTTTDANGHYTIDERLSKNKTYDLRFIYDKDAYYEVEGTPMNVGIDDDNTSVDCQLVPYGFTTYKLENVNCFDSNDVLSVKYTHKNLGDFLGSVPQQYLGCYYYEFQGSVDNSPPGYIKRPMGWNYYTGTITRNGITSPFKDSIYVTAGGQHTWNIAY